MPPAHDLTLTHHDTADAAKLMDALCDVYADAYGVEPDGDKTAAFRTRASKALDRTFALAEIEVRRGWQGEGVGRVLNDTVLAQRQEERATLATGPQADAARAIYEGWGWQPVGKIPGKPGSYFSEYTLYVLALRRDDGV